jgi:hydroxymethylpyrimidine pyrophosphatase-like HAD family hydrolase
MTSAALQTRDEAFERDAAGAAARAPALEQANSAARDMPGVAALHAFLDTHDLIGRGGLLTDLDGTLAVEQGGEAILPDAVVRGLTALGGAGCRVMINTPRSPANVIRAFGPTWPGAHGKAVPLVALNGSLVGYLRPEEGALATFREIAAYPVLRTDIDAVLAAAARSLDAGQDDLVVLFHSRDWTAGERIWTPSSARIDAVRRRFPGTGEVIVSDLDELERHLRAQEICMMLLLEGAAGERPAAFRRSAASCFVTRPGVDKRFGALALAEIMAMDLAHSIGAGDSPIDTFLTAVGFAVQVGGQDLGYRGTAGALRMPDPPALGRLLLDVAGRRRPRR